MVFAHASTFGFQGLWMKYNSAMKKYLFLAEFFLLVGAVGFLLSGGSAPQMPSAGQPEADYTHGYFPQSFFDAAYADLTVTKYDAAAALVAHHLLVKEQIAEVFETIARDDVRTIVLVSPNHFSVGISPMQVSTGSWSTPYGVVASDEAAVSALRTAMPELRHEELAAPGEHGIAALTPFVARSFPSAKIVPIMLDESLSAEAGWLLGEAIAKTLPDALLVASIDMTHYRDAAYTATNDAAVIATLEDWQACGASHCTVDFDIDSNASLRTLFGFLAERHAGTWHMTHHGSSLEMGATDEPEENTSHILGYFLREEASILPNK